MVYKKDEICFLVRWILRILEFILNFLFLKIACEDIVFSFYFIVLFTDLGYVEFCNDLIVFIGFRIR